MPKAPRWLTESFRDGVDERYETEILDVHDELELPCACWLAQFDKAGRPCEGRFERFHFIGRQRVEHALGAKLRGATVEGEGGHYIEREPLIQLAAWDSRNGGIACEAHHRRFDKHLVSLPSEEIVVPYSALPEHVLEFAEEWGLEDELEAKFQLHPEDQQEGAIAAPEGAAK